MSTDAVNAKKGLDVSLAINPVRYPTLSRYIGMLPQGPDSHPSVTTVGDLILTQLNHYPQLKELRDLPPQILHILQRPYRGSDWIPEVHLMCVSALVRDVICRSDEAYLKNRYEIIRETVRGGFFRTALSLVSPTLLAFSVERHWRSIKRGVQLNTLSTGNQEREVQLIYPENLYITCLVQGIAKAFESLLALSHAKEASSETKVLSSTESRVIFRWRT